MRVLKWLVAALIALLLAGAGLAAQTWLGKPLSVNWFYNKVFLQFALESPELLTSLRLLESAGMRGHNAKLDDASLAHEDAQLVKLKADYATFKTYDSSKLTGQDKLSYDIFDYFTGMQVKGEPWRYHNFPVNQMFGVHSNMPNLMTQQQQVNDATDAEHYLARLSEYPRKMAQVIESIKLRESKGILPPKFAVEKVLNQISEFLKPGEKGNALVVGLKEKLDKIPADKMSADAKAALVSRAEQAVKTSVTPAYQSLAQLFEALKTKATRNDGAWSLPDGEKFYEYTIEEQTTTKMSADQIHQIGLSEVARLNGEMDAMLKLAGYTEGKLAERIHKLGKSPDQLYADNDAGRAQILKDYQSIISEITAGLDKNFNVKPKAAVEVKRVPEFSEKGAPGAYYQQPPLDGSKPGTFFANLADINDTPKFGMRTLAYHEAVPGHHMQIAIAQEVPGLPIFRSVIPFTAYAEGWALYSERLAWETGYQSKPLDNLGRLQAEMFRAVRLVVDTGLHAKRWTREQAIDYMIANTGMTENEVVTEIERYIVNPGQALAYKVGMMKILELRERAKTKLGAKFDIREFHDEVLKNGAMPLTVLENVIDAYIASKKSV